MPTPAEVAFARGRAANASVHGKTWTFGASSFAGVASVLSPDDPKLEGSTDRRLVLIVDPADLPVVPPVRGDTLAQGSNFYRITRADFDSSTGDQYFVLASA